MRTVNHCTDLFVLSFHSIIHAPAFSPLSLRDPYTTDVCMSKYVTVQSAIALLL